MKKYYEAYEKRYEQIHSMNLEWSSDNPSPIVEEIINRFSVSKESKILELGCGEGRDSFSLLKKGYDVCATDISLEAVKHCKRKKPEYESHFKTLNACEDKLDDKFDLIYSIAVLHMLVLDEDRNKFLTFVKNHLTEDGIALILTMGDGELEKSSDVSKAFENAERVHEETGKTVQVAETSCRIVSFDTFEKELAQNGLTVLEKGITAIEPGFPVIMYAVVR